MRVSKKWKIYIITHKNIIESYYENDRDFNKDNWSFINVSDDKLCNEEWYKLYNIVDMHNLPNFKKLGSWYAETEAIYNIYKNEMHLEYDYIGFIHYDYELKDEYGNLNITEMINKLLEKYDLLYLSTTFGDYNARIMADPDRPNQLTGDGLNCYDYIINDYNKYYGLAENVDEFKLNIKKNICSAFLCSRKDFTEMMRFSSFIIESGKLDMFDTEHRYRFQGGIFERYFSVFIDKLKIPFYNLELNHIYTKK